MVEKDPLQGHDKKTRGQIEAMIEAERRALARRRRDFEGLAIGQGKFFNSGRRGVVFAAGSTLAAALAYFLPPARAADRKAPPGAVWRDAPVDPTKAPGTPIGEDGGYGSRSEFETEVHWR